ncbi:efflux RND transporter permease subunit [Chitinophaga flava]|uniref:Acriflavine resistance protein B n=1 Tax=Chitinophaga flava TaxID=2259036 RepID=A0A365XRE7_9BACT|nr:efflux RND transporter permease subunit [Chitinophaga flava]RBL88912.1 acriflavine resistance protein B [Chitinophaga flava]
MKQYFVAYRNPIAVMTAIIILGGLFAYGKIRSALFPEITFPKIKIIAEAGQQPVNKMMITVTRPLELAIKQVPDLQTIRSVTSRGSCEIAAFMDWSADIDISQQRISSRIEEIKNTLPPDISIRVERMNPSILPVSGYTLEGTGLSPIDLKYLATYTIKPFLSQVEGVAEIRVIGGKNKEYWVELDRGKMNTLGITPEMIGNALNQTNFIKSNGYLTDYRLLYLTVTDALVSNRQQLENIVISNNGQRIVLLKDIAAVGIREAKEYIKINANGHEGVLIAVIKQPNANLVDVSDRMERQLAVLRKTLPAQVKIAPYYVQADFVQDAIRSVTDSLWVGLLLAILVAVIFLRSAKASFTIMISIPVTLLLTLIVLYTTGQTFNIMTLGAIAAAIGLIIDDAIVVVEQLHRTHEEHPGEPGNMVVHKAIDYLLPAMVGSSLSTIVIFLPFVLMTGVAGAYFKVMTNTMIVTLICSFLVTWLVLPVIYLLLGKKHIPQKLPPGHTLKRQRWVTFFITRPWLSVLLVLVLIIAAVLILPRLETGFLPEMDEGSIVMDYSSPPGTSLEETDRILREVEKIITATPEVAAYSRRTGTQMGFFITEPNRGDYLIQLKKDRRVSTNEVIDKLRQKIEASQPALRVDFGQVIGDMLGDLMTSVQPVEVKIFGNDPQALQVLARQVAAVVKGVKGTADVFDGIVIAGPGINITLNTVALAQYGITPASLQYQLQAAQEGNVAGSVFEKEQLSPIRLVYPGNSRLKVAEIGQLQVFLPGGKLRPVTDFARIEMQGGDAEINRENLQSMGLVTARLNNSGLGTVMKKVDQEIHARIQLPQGYSIMYGGAYAEQQQSFRELLMILITASLLVFGVILFLYRSVQDALIILLVAVLGITGSYIALYITGTPLNVGSYTGLIMIVGIIGENAIFTFLQFHESMLHTEDADEAIVYAISTRLRPKLMTALGAIVALMPIALGIGTGAQLHQPLAIAVIGGFLVAMPLLLIVLPAFMRWRYKR